MILSRSLKKGKKKTTWPKSAKRIKVPLFESDVWIFTDQRILNQARKSLGKKEFNTPVAGLNWHFRVKGFSYFFLGVFDKRVSTLLHELGHLTFNLLKFYGIPLDKKKWPANEMYCYLYESLYRTVRKTLKLKEQ